MRHTFLALVPLALLGSQEDAERLKMEKEHDASQRPIQLQLVSASYDRVKLEDVLADITRQRGTKFVQQIHPTTELSLILKSVSIRQLYDAIEDQLCVTFVEQKGWTEVQNRKFKRKPRAHAPGIAFEFTRRELSAGGAVVSARALGPARAFVTSWEVIGDDGKSIRMDRCAVCEAVHVADAKGGLRVRLKGQIQWESVYPIEIANPRERSTIPFGPYVIACDFPKVTVTSERETPYWLFPTAAWDVVYKKGKAPYNIHDEGGCGTEPAKQGPCNCEPGPKPVVVGVPSMRKRTMTSLGFDTKPDDCTSIKLLFRKPIQESFEVEAVIPAD